MEFKVTGKFKGLTPPQKVTETFSKKTLFLDTEADYNNHMVFELGGKKIDIADGLKKDQAITVYFNIDCHQAKATGRWFTSLKAWKIAPPDATSTDTAGSFPGVADEPQNNPFQ